MDRADLGADTKACKTTIDIIFGAEQRQLDPLILLEQPITQPGMETALPHYSVEIVEGVVAGRGPRPDRRAAFDARAQMDAGADTRTAAGGVCVSQDSTCGTR